MYYIIREFRNDVNVSVSKTPENIDRFYELTEGVSRIDDWPDDVVFEYSGEKPEGMVLTDWIDNSYGWMIVSDNFKAFLEDLGIEYLEYLPVGINDHKKRIRPEKYWIANFTKLHSAVDLDKSVYGEGLEEGQIDFIEKLVLKKDVEKNGPPIFRFKEEPNLIAVRDNIKSAMEKSNLTGVFFIPTDEYES